MLKTFILVAASVLLVLGVTIGYWATWLSMAILTLAVLSVVTIGWAIEDPNGIRSSMWEISSVVGLYTMFFAWLSAFLFWFILQSGKKGFEISLSDFIRFIP